MPVRARVCVVYPAYERQKSWHHVGNSGCIGVNVHHHTHALFRHDSGGRQMDVSPYVLLQPHPQTHQWHVIT